MNLVREKLDWSKYGEVDILPEEGKHPRLLIRKDDIATIKDNFKKVQNLCAAHEFEKLYRKQVNFKLGKVEKGEKNVSPKILGHIEARAFAYLIYGDKDAARCAIDAIKDYLADMEFGKFLDYARPIGHAIFTAAEVYDWCYDVLTDDDKSQIISFCEGKAKMLEIGYPPVAQGAVVGHAGEAQILRDLLALGVAVYDECDDIYKFCMGRIVSEFVPVRNYFSKAHMHYQGDAYGFYRYTFELWSQAVIKKMSGKNLFCDEHGKMAYEWLYIRRPDGQFLRIGDDFNEAKLFKGQYWDENYPAMFLASNLYGDEYIKQEAIRGSEAFSRFIYDNMTLTPVQYLLLNDPDLWGRPIDELDKAKYFSTPEGTIIARTSWDSDLNTDQYNKEDINADCVIAYMRIGERWTANHQHVDAGNFQLYYKGILASESGCYDYYYSPHDLNYNKETIAHNCILIHDPDEVFEGRVNCGGQKRPEGGEPDSFERVMMDDFETGKVYAHAISADAKNPEYAYICGDIAKAYSQKAKEVLRAMTFMPLDNDEHKGVMFVGDKISVSNPSFKKTFLLHTQQEPQFDGNVVYVKNTDAEHRGAMQMHMILPKKRMVDKIGGEGMEYAINGVNYPLVADYKDRAVEAGKWRIEISPDGKNKTDYMLNVLLAGELSSNDNAAKVYEIDSENHFGAQVYDRACVFSKSVSKNNTAEFEIFDSGYKEYKVILCGMEAGEYEVKNGGKATKAFADEDGGVLWLCVKSGNVRVAKI